MIYSDKKTCWKYILSLDKCGLKGNPYILKKSPNQNLTILTVIYLKELVYKAFICELCCKGCNEVD